jgi:quercetin dioxygenase-like cupin family protein
VNQYTTSLVRMLPGTRLPMHRHKGVEQFFVLEGDCHVHDEVLGPGDYHRAEAGSIHESTYTESGTLFLLIAPPDYEIIKVH